MLSLLAIVLAAAACGGGRQQSQRTFADIGAEHAEPAASIPLQMQWFLDLVPKYEGSYVPVERSGVAIDPVNRLIFAGSSRGALWTLGWDGHKVRDHPMGAAIEAPPVIDPTDDRVWAVAVTGEVHALTGSTGDLLWKADVGGPVSTELLLSDDALYAATDGDSVVALSRRDGEVLWRYTHEGEPRELSIAGHAGLLLDDGRIITGLSDGTVIALDAGDGRELWHLNTSIDVDSRADLGAFVDVDTTPVRVGTHLYVASFAAGLYDIDPGRGVVQGRYFEHVGVTSLAANEHSLVLSSADAGIVCVDRASMTRRWVRAAASIRGAATQAQIRDGLVFVGESRGALLILALSDGLEQARIEAGHGYSASPVLQEHRGFILSNTARLLAFVY